MDISIYDGAFCDRSTCSRAFLIGEQNFDGEKWFEYSCNLCTYYFIRKVPAPARKTHFKLLEHQLKAVKKLGNGKVLWGGTGSGKSVTAIAYYIQKEAPRPIYVITTAKKRDSKDWIVDAAKFGVGEEPDASIAGVIKVDSWNNLKNYVDIQDAFFIFDEQRLVGTGSWYKSFIKIAKNNRWILLSATPGDTWLDYTALFVANGFYKNLSQFKQEHVVYNTFVKYPKVERYQNVGKLIRQRNSILVHMPYLKHTVKHTNYIDVDFDEGLFDKVFKNRWHVYKDRPLNNIAEMFLVLRKVVNSDPSRVNALKELMKKHPKLIVFYNFDYELDILRELVEEEWTANKTGLKSTTNNEQQTTDLLSHIGSDLKSHRSSEKKCEMHTPKSSLSQTVLQSTPTRINGADPHELSATKNGYIGVGQSPYPSTSTNKPVENAEQIDQTSTFAMVESTGSPSTPSAEESSKSKKTNTVSESFAVAEWNGHKHQEIPKTDRWVYLVQYVAGSEGWNCIETDALILFSLNYSYKITHQSMGRIDRLNTPYTDLYYYIFKSNSMIDNAVWKALKSKKSFNESSYSKAQKW